MSARWRNQRNNGKLVTQDSEQFPTPILEPDDVVLSQILYNPLPQYGIYYGGTQEREPQYPGQWEVINREADRYTPAVGYIDSQGNDTYNLIDREIGGQRGWVDDLPYSMGVVSSDLVENYALTGEQAVIRRTRNPSDHGSTPVGTSDYSSHLALLYEMNASEFYPNEMSQADLVRSV